VPGACEERAAVAVALEARHHLWRATDAPAHRRAAVARLDHLVLHAPAEDRSRMVEAVPLHREVAEAARAAGLRRDEGPVATSV
jgi:hypothetical protein